MIFTFYSFVMAVLTNSLLIVLIYFLRKSKYFLKYFGINPIAILYTACIFRMVVPFEMPNFQVRIEDFNFYPMLIKAITFNTPEAAGFDFFSSLTILALVWLIVAIIFVVRLFVKYNKSVKYFKGLANGQGSNYSDTLEKIKTECGIKSKISIIKSSKISSPLCYGFFNPTILLPNKEYSQTELYYVIKHECFHIKNKDVWVKLFIELYCSIFWWNPFSYLLKKDLTMCLELKCDSCVTKKADEGQRLDYFETLLNSLKGNAKTYKKQTAFQSNLLGVEFARSENHNRTIQRFSAISEAKHGNAVANTITCLFAVVIIFFSYVFIIQPAYVPTNADIGISAESNDTVVEADESNAYILKKADGTYVLYFMGATEVLSAKDVESGMYPDFPIIEE